VAVTETKDHSDSLRALRFSSLDAQYQREYTPGPLAGVRIHLSALSQYSKAPEIASTEDDDLLGAVESELSLQVKKRKIDYGNFLRPTQYDEYAVQKVTPMKRQSSTTRPRGRNDASKDAELSTLLKNVVLQQFENGPTRHPNRKNATAGAKPVRSIPWFPDFSLFHEKFVVVQFDEHPLKAEDQDKLGEEAITIGYSGPPDYLAYNVPKSLPEGEPDVGAQEHQPKSYECVREFEFTIRNRGVDQNVTESCMPVLGQTDSGTPIAQYCDISSMMRLHKRLTTALASSSQGIEAPSETRGVVTEVDRVEIAREKVNLQESMDGLCTPLDLETDAAALEED